MPKSNAVLKPNLGLYFDRPRIALGARMLHDGLNFRVKEGKLNNLNLGWDRFGDFELNGPVLLIDNFLLSDGTEQLIFATQFDLYKYNANNEDVSYISPRYATGTASASGTAVTGVGTTWSTNAKAGDEIHFGNAAQVDPTATWFEIDEVVGNTSITLTASAGTVANGVYTIRKKFTGDTMDLWSTDIFGRAAPSAVDEWWATNGVDDVVRWNGTDTQVEVMSALNFKCKVLCVYKNMMIFANLTQSGTSKPADMINSQIGEPQNVTSGLSEQFKVHASNDSIVEVRPLGDNLAIYSRKNVVISQFVGDPLIFIFRTAMTGVGAKAGRAIADFGNYHEFIAADSHYIFDGVNVKEVNPHVWRDIIRQQDPIRIGFSFHHFDDENGDLLWIVPSTIDPGAGNVDSPPSRAYAEHYLEGHFETQHPTPYSVRSFPFTSTGYYTRQDGITWQEMTQRWSELNFRWNDQFFFSAFPLSLAGDADGRIYTLNTSQDANDAALPSFVQFGRRAVFDGRNRGLITRIYPFCSSFSTPMDVTLYMADAAEATTAITDTQSFDQTMPQGGHFTVHYRRGRFFALEFGSDGPGNPWEISGYDLDAKPGGGR